MKPPAFSHHEPRTVEEAVDLLGQEPLETSVLAGGQSLVPALNMRLAEPSRLVDINGVEGLDAIDLDGGGIRIGATVRQRRVERDEQLAARVPLLVDAVRHIAHPAIRTRGTICGSLAHADPAAELPAAVTALDGSFRIRNGDGERTVEAGEFFRGPLTTAIDSGELLTGIEITEPPAGSGAAFVEIARTHGAFALAAAAAVVHLDGETIDHARLALAGVGSVPFTPDGLDESLLGERPEASLFDAVGRQVADRVQPFDDIHATAAYRRRVAGSLASRALQLAVARAREASR